MNLCKAIPNIDAEAVTDALGNVSYKYTVKGLPPTKPTENAKKPPEPPAPKAVETVTPEPDPTVPAKPTPEEAEDYARTKELKEKNNVHKRTVV